MTSSNLRVVIAAAVAALAATVAATVAAARADAAPTWRSAVDLTPPGYAVSDPRIALTAEGDAVAAWLRGTEPLRPAPIGEPPTPFVVQAVMRGRGGEWSDPVNLSQPSPFYFSRPRVVLADSGIAVAAWRSGDRDARRFESAYRRQTWARIDVPGGIDGPFDVAVTPAGAAVLVWAGNDGRTRASYRAVTTGAWSAPLVFDDGATVHLDPRVAFDGAGNAVAIWVSRRPDGWIVTSARRDALTGAWSLPVPISTTADLILSTKVVGDVVGGFHAIWKSRRGLVDTIETASRIASFERWEPPVALEPANRYAVGPDLAADSSGTVAAVWNASDGATMHTRAAYRAAGHAWQPAVTISAPGGDALSAKVALDRAGNVAAIWHRYSAGRDDGVHAALRPRSLGTWLAPVRLGAGAEPEIALDGYGNGIALWTDGVIRAASLDAAPFITQVAAPKRGTVGARLAFAVSRQPWGTAFAGLPRWSFGDGTTARGVVVRHRYRRPGVYTVTVRQADRSGGTASASARVTIRRR